MIHMRVISQDGRHDFSYENSCITSVGGSVIANDGKKSATLANYDEDEKATLALKILREHYADNYAYFQFPQDLEIWVNV